MSDIQVTLRGDGSGAKNAFHEGGEGAESFAHQVGEATEQAKLFYEGIEHALEKVLEFGKESVESFFKIEHAEMQLRRAAGDATEAFIDQANALSEHLGVSKVTTETIQKMLATFGEAPAEVEATTQAIIDYAAYSGQDAVGATEALLSSAKTGRAAFKDLNLEYDKTGTALERVSSISSALTAKLGGTAEEESNTLEGALKKSEEQMTRLKESIGFTIAEFLQETGVVSTLTETLKKMNAELLASSGGGDSQVKIFKYLEEAQDKLKRMKAGQQDNPWEFITPESIEKQEALIAKLDASWTALVLRQQRTGEEAGRKAGLEASGLTDLIPGQVHEEKTPKVKAAEAERHQIANLRQLDRDDDEKQEKWDEEHNARLFGTMEENVANTEKENEKLLRIQQDGEKKTEEEYKKQEEKVATHIKQLNEVAARAAEKFEREMEVMGAQIGQALTSTLAGAIQAAIDGQEFDVLGAVADLAFGVAAIIGTAIGTIYGSPALGNAIGSGIGAIGGLVHSARGKAWKDEQSQKRHDGGWIETFHDGGWPGLGTDEQAIVAQAGERMLSRSEVSRMGGARNVDAAARGGGGSTHITIHAQDSQSMLEFFQGRGGRSFTNALRTGRGDLNALFP